MKRFWMFICMILIAVIIYYQYIKKEDAPLPTALHPVVEERTNQLIQNMADQGITIVITDGFRSVEEQNILYEQGRTTAGQVIWDMEFDGNGNGSPDWMEVVERAKELGFEWGGDWMGFEDYPHLQLDFGLSLNELQNGKRPTEEALTAY